MCFFGEECCIVFSAGKKKQVDGCLGCVLEQKVASL